MTDGTRRRLVILGRAEGEARAALGSVMLLAQALEGLGLASAERVVEDIRTSLVDVRECVNRAISEVKT